MFKVIMSEALRMLDVPRDIPEELEAKNNNKKTPEPKVEDDVSIADLGEPKGIMEEEPSARQLLAEQIAPKPAEEDEIPAAKGGADGKVEMAKRLKACRMWAYRLRRRFRGPRGLWFRIFAVLRCRPWRSARRPRGFR